ncbi:MAG: hypothetical protein AAF542_04215 [Pseudomonadota bacterium]
MDKKSRNTLISSESPRAMFDAVMLTPPVPASIAGTALAVPRASKSVSAISSDRLITRHLELRVRLANAAITSAKSAGINGVALSVPV